MEAEYGSDNEDNDHIIKSIKDSDEEKEDLDQDIESLIDNEDIEFVKF